MPEQRPNEAFQQLILLIAKLLAKRWLQQQRNKDLATQHQPEEPRSLSITELAANAADAHSRQDQRTHRPISKRKA